MSKARKLINKLRHSEAFLKIIESADADIAIRTITHSKPVLVFWISPAGNIVNAKEAHHENPPDGDRSVLSDKIHKGFIRGRAAFIGDVLYIVIYGEDSGQISKRQLALLRRSYPRLLRYLMEQKDLTQSQVDAANFIDEQGNEIIL